MKEAAIAILFSPSQDQVLLIKRRDIPVWVLPGGGIDDGERADEAVIREVKEESGLEASVDRLAGVFEATNALTRRTHLFTCAYVAGELSCSDESSDVRFFPLRQLPKDFFILHRKLLEQTLDNPNVTLRGPLKQVTWLSAIAYLLRHPIWSLTYLYRRYISAAADI